MKFYKENKVNPMAGCLPLVFQMPVFFALYRVLRQPFAHLPTDSKLYSAFCGTEMPKACAAHPRGLSFLGVDLGRSASTIHSGFADALPYYLLIALVVATGYLQFKQSQSRQTAQANPQMAMMGKVFPVMFAFISFGLPSGVVLYFLVSNTWQIGQQALIYRTMPAPPVLPGATVPASGSTPRPTGKPAAEKPEAPVPDGPPEGRFKKALREGKEAIGKGGDQPTGNGNGDGQSKPAPKRPPVAGGGGRPAGAGDGGMGRAQPSGSPPRPKKRRR
jgi:YidC/Oxa1 family membrane protein insertase